MCDLRVDDAVPADDPEEHRDGEDTPRTDDDLSGEERETSERVRPVEPSLVAGVDHERVGADDERVSDPTEEGDHRSPTLALAVRCDEDRRRETHSVFRGHDPEGLLRWF